MVKMGNSRSKSVRNIDNATTYANVMGTKDLDLEQEARRYLPNGILEKLIEWYEMILHEDAKYVVFMVRRSYILALMLEKITGKSMIDTDEKMYLTDSSALLHSRTMYEDYVKYGVFSKILVVDDILIHGRNINNFLRTMEHQIQRFHSQQDTKKEPYAKEKLRDAFISSLSIYVFEIAETSFLLSPRYEMCLKTHRHGKFEEWRELSGSISSLIFASNITNATYVFSTYISNDRMEGLKSNCSLLRTKYQNNVQYLKTYYFKNSQNNVTAMGAIRFVENSMGLGYRVVPLMIVPSLSADQYRNLWSSLIAVKNNETIDNWFQKLLVYDNKRGANELMTMILSVILLKDFYRSYNLSFDECDLKYEIIKLARNYSFSDRDSAYKRILSLINLIDLSIKDLEIILSDILDNNTDLLEFKQLEIVLTQDIQRKYRKKIEDKIYKQGWLDEKNAFELSKRVVFDSVDTLYRENEGCYELLKKMLNNDNSISARDYKFSVFLQMMDAGILGLSSNPSASSAKNVVKGFEQLIKAGEQALFLRPIRMYKYIPVLSEIETQCGSDQDLFWNEVERFLNRVKEDDSNTDCADIKKFIDELYEINQHVSEWNGNFFQKIDFSEDNRVEEMVDFFFDQVYLRDVYRNMKY